MSDSNKTTIYAKLNLARKRVHAVKLAKTGKNQFAGYNYFELNDFLPASIDACDQAGICGIVSFDSEFARLKLFDIETKEFVEITSPMSEANLKGCHPVQNLGAVETYQRRYLWSAAMEISESDAVDASEPQKTAIVKQQVEATKSKVVVEQETVSAQSSTTAPKEETWMTVLKDVKETKGVNKKTGKPWKRYGFFFSNGRIAGSFSQSLAEEAVPGPCVAQVKPGPKDNTWDSGQHPKHRGRGSPITYGRKLRMKNKAKTIVGIGSGDKVKNAPLKKARAHQRYKLKDGTDCTRLLDDRQDWQ